VNALHIVLNSFENDSRVLRAATAGLEFFDDVHVFALHEEGLPLRAEQRGVSVQRFHLRSRRLSKIAWIQAIKYAELLARMLVSGAKLKPSLVHAHDVHGLIIGYCIARATSARLVYDSHEYWADVQGYRDLPRSFVRTFLGAQAYLSRRSDAVITVCNGIADRLRAEIGLSSVDVVRNTPEKWTLSDTDKRLRRDLGVSAETLLILYQGGLSSGRGVERLLDAYLQSAIADSSLVFMGNGTRAEELRARVAAAGAGDRVHVIDAVPPNVLPCYTSDADIGVLPLEPLCESYNLALPNKLFEYLQGGLAIISSDLPEIARVVREESVGCLYPYDSAARLAEAIKLLAGDPVLLRQYKSAAERCRDRYCWEAEKEQLLSVYRRILPT
jgi:glycosyltransferase involved in cell wall biosynthesis